MSEHSPLPWRIENPAFPDTVSDANGNDVTTTALAEETSVQQDAANIALIVRAVNAHEALVAALKRIEELCAEDGGAHWLTRNDTTRALCRAALAAAKGDQP